MVKDIEQPEIQESEIDLVELIIKLWNNRRFIMKSGLIAAIIGIIISLSIPKEYEVTVTLVPELTGASGNGSARDLAAIAGINIGGNTGGRDAVYPGLYPDVVKSIPFAMGLLDVELPTDINDNDILSLKQILTQYTSKPWWSIIAGLPGRLVKLFEDSELTSPGIAYVDSLFIDSEFYQPKSMHLTKSQNILIDMVNSCIDVSVDSKTQLINITVTMQDALAATSLADTVTNRLTDFVIAYRTNKSRQDLAFAKHVNEEARTQYYKAQQAYAKAVDQNQRIVMKSAVIDLTRLQDEATLAYNMYNSTSQQVQMAEVKVQENTPVFTVVHPAILPLKASKPRWLMIIAILTFLGVIGAIGYTLIVPPLIQDIKNK